jgi:hypothetical protein
MAPDNRHARLARRCGYWSAARRMAKSGYPLETALRRLLGVRPIPVLTERAPLLIRWWFRWKMRA